MDRGGLTRNEVVKANQQLKQKAVERLRLPLPPPKQASTKKKKKIAHGLRGVVITVYSNVYHGTLHECCYCHEEIDARDSEMYTVDHLVPLQNGGANDIRNMRPCCLACNREKAFLMPDEWLNILHKQFEATGSNNPQLLYKIMRVTAVHRYVQRMGSKLYKK